MRSALLDVRAATQEQLASLQSALDEVVGAAAGSNADDEHDPEGATIAYEREQLAAHRANAEHRLAGVEAALARLDSGTYGVCVTCGSAVAAERLAARPEASECVPCAAGDRSGMPR